MKGLDKIENLIFYENKFVWHQDVFSMQNEALAPTTVRAPKKNVHPPSWIFDICKLCDFYYIRSSANHGLHENLSTEAWI